MTAKEEARARSIAWAREVAADPHACFLDTETTGLGDDAEICDLGVVRVDGTVLLDCLVKPSRPIPAGATAVHGISDAMVAGAEPWEVAHGRLVVATASRVVVYNRDYDLGVINRLCERHELPTFARFERWECAMRAFADFVGIPGKRPGEFAWHKLDAAAAHFGLAVGGHRARSDADTARKVVLAMAASAGEKPEAMAQGALFWTTDAGRFTR